MWGDGNATPWALGTHDQDGSTSCPTAAHNDAMPQVWAFVRLSRPHFLLGGFLMFGLGASTARELDPLGYLVGQVMVTASQVTAHYVNEWADVEPDRMVARRTLFSGGSGVLTEGLLSPTVALRAAWVTTVIAIVAAGALAFISVPAALLGLAALGISWSYSTPPLRLLGTGWGEAATSLVVAVMVPLIGVLAQGDRPGTALWRTVGILFLLHVAMMLAFELPDVDSDGLSGKRVMAVRIGRRRTVLLIGALLTIAGAGLAFLRDQVPGAVGAGIAGILPATVLLASIPRRMDRTLTISAVATFVAVAAGMLVGALRWL